MRATDAGPLAPAGGASHAAPLHPGSVHLIVRDLARVRDYYLEAIGLDLVGWSDGVANLGAGGATLLRLEQRSDAAPARPDAAGLFHTAILVPSRADLGAWVGHAANHGIALDGASDHLVSEALYLSDPEGNGIEIYADRPPETWAWEGDQVVMGTKRLDLDALIEAASGRSREKLPAATRVGHVHLKVGAIPEAESFWSGVMGLDVVRRIPKATFFATGRYHHHLATNVWQSAGAGRRQPGAAGLASFTLEARDAATFSTAAERLLRAGGRRSGETIAIEDPWGTRAELCLAPA